VDGVSWRILLEDLQTAYQQLRRGETVRLPAKTTSFKRWAELLKEYAESESVGQELSYWTAAERNSVAGLPRDNSAGQNLLASARSVRMFLTEEETRALLQDVPRAYHTQINDVLLSAMAEGFAAWSGERVLLVDLEGHGREELGEEVDVSRTVGWFTTMFPIVLELGAGSDPGETLKRIKEQLRGVPKRGLGYGLLRSMSSAAGRAEKLAGMQKAEIIFNYLGQLDQILDPSMYVPARESSGPQQHLGNRRTHLLEVYGSVAEGRLQLKWTYSANIHNEATIKQLAQASVDALRRLIAHCVSDGTGGYTPSDFPKARLDQADLDKLVAQIAQQSRRVFK
jgi:non-ribosomal peptide synthase protein (TIGR01720 family)